MKTIAIVGISNNPERESYKVGKYLKEEGFNIIPINPNIDSFFGLRSYKSILEVPKKIKIDIVDVFRKPTEVISILREVVESKRKPLIWLQEGVGSTEAKEFAQKNGLEIIMDFCLMKKHKEKEVL